MQYPFFLYFEIPTISVFQAVGQFWTGYLSSFHIVFRLATGEQPHKAPVPTENPLDEDVEQRCYHYLSPRYMMPSHIFIHFLHRARGKNWGDDTWLERLPKKLNKSVLTAQASNTNSDLVFGWGVRILDGPNHAVLVFCLAFGLSVTFVISCMIVGLAKTQEQAFGVGQYLVAIVVALMSAMCFKLQDR